MDDRQRWNAAQETEVAFWDGFIHSEASLLDTLARNAEKAEQLRSMLRSRPQTCLEVGIGPLGVGVTGFLPEVRFRVGVDPLPAVEPECAEPLRLFIRARRSPIRYVVACGEELPVASASMDLVVSCNVLDHTWNPDVILAEMSRVLRPDGFLFLDVHTFSVLGLVKWHIWTKRRYRHEILVKAHPYRFFERTMFAMLKARGFEILESRGHSLLSLCLGGARTSVFLAGKSSNGRPSEGQRQGR